MWLRSRFVLFRCFSAGETEIWPGDLRVVAVAVCSLFICVSMMCLGCKAKEFIFFEGFLPLLSLSGPALERDRPQQRKKKHCQRKHRKSIPRHVAKVCDNNTQKTTSCFDKDWRHGGGEKDPSISNRVPRNHAIPLHSQKYYFLVSCCRKKRSLQQSHFRSRKHIDFLDSKKWSSPVALKAAA